MSDGVSTVGDLLDYLAAQPRDRLVILAKDAEGNRHSPLVSADEGFYLAETTWSGQVVSSDEWEDGEDPDGVPAIILGPVN